MSKVAIRTMTVLGTVLAVILLFFVALSAGSLQVATTQLLQGLYVSYDETVATIFDLRFPRVFIALLGGAATATSGVLLQAALCNPLADPGIIGISSGASLAAILVVAVSPGLLFLTPACACLGGLLAFIVVYSLSWRDGLSPLRIILVGIAVSTALSGLVTAFNSASSSQMSGVASIVNANISMKTWDDVWTLVPYTVVGLIVALFLAHRCDLLQLEDKTVRSLGVNIGRTRLIVSFVAVVLASISTAIIGPISFLGLIVPHIARLLMGTEHRFLLPYSMILGSFCLLLCDTLGRMIAAPHEISAATLMAVVGGPVFVVLLRKSRSLYVG